MASDVDGRIYDIAGRRVREVLSVHTQEIAPLGRVTVIAAGDAAACFRNDESLGMRAAFSGWALYRGAVTGALRELARDLARAESESARLRVLGDVEAGWFTLLLVIHGKPLLVTDPLGLHAHFAPQDDTVRALAPSPGFVAATHPVDRERLPLLLRLNHLFGNATGREDIERLDPDSLIAPGQSRRRYVRYDPETVDAEEILARLRRVSGLFEPNRRVLPLSGGLDSRLLLATGVFDRGFTFGPWRTGDRPVARQFATGCDASVGIVTGRRFRSGTARDCACTPRGLSGGDSPACGRRKGRSSR